jgi:hypothetical protein
LGAVHGRRLPARQAARHDAALLQREVGPRGGITRINPVDLWTSNDTRVVVRGLRMRPDQPRPTYTENGETYVNIYAPPTHDAEGGSPAGGQLLLEQLLPNAFERQWFTRWLAFKLRFPHIPGPGVVMVARSFGTGRGTLAELVERLFGPRYVRQLPFSLFAGKTLSGAVPRVAGRRAHGRGQREFLQRGLDTCEPAPTRHKPTGRPNASSRPACANGPTQEPIRPHGIVQTPPAPGPTATNLTRPHSAIGASAHGKDRNNLLGNDS